CVYFRRKADVHTRQRRLLCIAGAGVRQGFGERKIRFDINHRRPVDEIEAAEFQYYLIFLTANALELNERHADGIRAKR
ncbi:hypothetical protein AZ019_005134, partial [Klebsiella pneumoniae]